MTISGKHTIEALNGTRCALLEKDASAERADFLRRVLEHNGYKVEIQKNVPPPPKKVATETEGAAPVEPAPAVPETFKVGVTDRSFVLSVMLYTRRLRTLDGRVLLPAYWSQEDERDNGWYWKSEHQAQLSV